MHRVGWHAQDGFFLIAQSDTFLWLQCSKILFAKGRNVIHWG
jgi:hypothetical protein